MTEDLGFFMITMPDTRPADYYLGCLEGSVFMDFDDYEGELIRLKRISFDGYGCCDLIDQAIPMNVIDSRNFKEMLEGQLLDQSRLAMIVKKTILNNRKLIWEEALTEYGLA